MKRLARIVLLAVAGGATSAVLQHFGAPPWVGIIGAFFVGFSLGPWAFE